SGTSFAWTNEFKKPPKRYDDLNVAGMKAHAALADEFGATPWWHGGGSLEWEAEPDRTAQRENIEQLRSWGYAAEWLTLRQVRELEPDIDPMTIGDAPVAFFPEEGWLDPVVYAHAMLSAARLRHGAKVISGARVVDLIITGDRVTGVRVDDGRPYEADTVVSRVVRTTVIDARPDGAGRLMLHWNPTDAILSFDTRLSPSMPEARDLVRRARQLLPSIGEVEPEAVRIAIRPIPGDHLSAIGPMPRASGYYVAITHSGVTMSPFLGAAVADEVVRGRERAELADFRPARFFSWGRSRSSL